MRLKRAESLGALALIVFFFFPWFSAHGFSITGYELPRFVRALEQLATLGERSSSPSIWPIYLVYLIPGGSLATFVVDEAGWRPQVLGGVTGVLPLVGCGYMVAQTGLDILEVLGSGAYLTVVAGLVLLLAAFGVFRLPTSSAHRTE